MKRYYLEDLDVDGRTILETILEKESRGSILDLSDYG
jgi:hypothetical protein